MASVHSVSFDTTGWIHYTTTPSQIAWVNARFHEGLTLTYHMVRGLNLFYDLSARLDAYREQTQRVIEAREGYLIDLDTELIAGVKALRQIHRLPMKEKPHTLIFEALYILPFPAFTFTITLKCADFGMERLRCGAIMAELFIHGEIPITAELLHTRRTGILPPGIGRIVYPAAYDPANDTRFPNHPLSRIRAHLRQIHDSLTFADNIHNARPL